MVGVGGRSKACDNCRRRRVKCGRSSRYHQHRVEKSKSNKCSQTIDETRPVCLRCVKAKLKCDGPRSMTIIQFHSGQQQERHVPTRDLEKHSGQHFSDASNSMTVTSDRFHFSRLQYSTGKTLIFNMKPEEDCVFMAYTRNHILHGQEPDHPNFSAPDMSLTEKCLLALSTTYFGEEHGHSALVHRGLRRYSDALSELNSALSDPNQCRTNDVLESVIVMSLFEVGFLQHHK